MMSAMNCTCLTFAAYQAPAFIALIKKATLFTQHHLHLNFGWPRRGNRSRGVSIMLNESKLVEHNVVSAEFPQSKNRVAHIRYKQSREDVSILGFELPPKLVSMARRREYWNTCNTGFNGRK